MGYLSCNAESSIFTCDPCSSKPKQNNKKNSQNIRSFTYSELESGTNGFSSDNFLGKGSHGSVYKAVLDNGKLIAAVKRTTIHEKNCTDSISTSAESEIEILSKVRNSNLVNLIGFCSTTKDNKKLIVVEYMSNGSLYDLLHSNKFKQRLSWTRRIRVALSVAKAVGILHSSDPPVIHRDIKSSNVLIDVDGNARLGDFGLALRGHVEDVRVRCTPPAGTLGYLDPCYLAPGDLSTKSDVFSYGILLLEIVSGRNAIDVNYSPPSLVDWAVPLIKRGEFDSICDPRIGSPADPAVIRQLVVLAARCASPAADKRPAMIEVIEKLKSIYKRSHAPIWNNFEQRVSLLRKSTPLIKPSSYFDGDNEDMIKTSKLGSRRNRKVSNVPGTEYYSKPVSNHPRGVSSMGRSKSIGSINDIIKPGSDSNSVLNNNKRVALIRRRDEVVVKMAGVKLSKSRSMGVLQSKSSGNNKTVNNSKEKGLFLVVKKPQIKESDECKLLVRFDKISEKTSL